MVDVPGPWLAVQLRPQVGGELAEVVQVRPHRMRGCVALTFQVPADFMIDVQSSVRDGPHQINPAAGAVVLVSSFHIRGA